MTHASRSLLVFLPALAAAGCGTSPEVERLYVGGWIFLGLIFLALVGLLALIVRYLRAGRRAGREPVRSVPETPAPTPPEGGEPGDWV
ncbi:MAG: hypothetical protein FJ098_07035 [Deltaproteobacteria bacterium]|nr:hypothetical protein [Deltaproteobacteria bacterium]